VAAVEAMKQGADDYLELPIAPEVLEQAVVEGQQGKSRLVVAPHPEDAIHRGDEHLVAVGRLAAGLAHDLNNLMTLLLGTGELLLERLGQDDPIRPDLVAMQRTVLRAGALTRRLLLLSRPGLAEPRPFDLNTLVGELAESLRRLLQEDIEIDMSLERAPAQVLADPSQLERLLFNVVLNARDAMPQGGRLTIRTERQTLSEGWQPSTRHVARNASPFPIRRGLHVVLTIEDTGCGMEAGVLQRIFDMFFTTKEPGQGTGLGLAGAQEVLRQAGGGIEAASTPGRGTTITVYLPSLSSPSPLAAAPAQPPVAAPGGSETILLAEDEPGVLALLSTFLRQKGYTVLESAQGPMAVQVSEQHSGPIQLLITDVIMPQMSGTELFQRLVAQRPDLRVLYISGYAPSELAERGVPHDEGSLLQKPFGIEELAQKVRASLGAERRYTSECAQS
jgi:signal transduction histidine kinase